MNAAMLAIALFRAAVAEIAPETPVDEIEGTMVEGIAHSLVREARPGDETC